jgi:ribosomal protein S18 acetylase RimI-like enzyme
MAASRFTVLRESASPVADIELEGLLKTVYVGGGYTDPEVGETVFRAVEIRARGDLLIARSSDGHVIGSISVVFPGSPACRFASAGEAELQLLCVSPEYQRAGIGTALVAAAVEHARSSGTTRVILWTQPEMTTAQRLYHRSGFERAPDLDFMRNNRSFLVLTRDLGTSKAPRLA